MTDVKPRRVSTWKIVGIVAAVVVALLLIGTFWAKSATEARWIRFREELNFRVDQECARDCRRPSLRGTAGPGNAWDDYSFAIVEMKNLPTWNPITKMFAPRQYSTERYLRERLAHLRLLRVATRYRRTGELLDLDDPFGAKLKSAKSGDAMKFWSVGADGVDNAGAGEWRPKAGAGIVLEARR